MLIIGCEFHTGYQQIAMMDTEAGELVMRLQRSHQNVVVLALANRLVRMAWGYF